MNTAIIPENIEFSDICRLFPKRKSDSHKGDFGRLLCITGSVRMPGAAAMSTYAALRSGTGLLTTATAKQNIPALSSRCWESMYLPLETDDAGFITWHGNEDILTDALRKADAVLLGCGMGVTEETRLLTSEVLRKTDVPVILDADGLNAAAQCIDILSERKAPLILTPHPGEMSRLLGISTAHVQRDRIGSVCDLCERMERAVIVLKGKGTLIGYEGGMLINNTGNPGMSRGGSGDVLAGMIASFAAQGLPPVDAAAAGVYIHGAAGDIAAERYSQQSMLPGDIIDCISDVFRKIEESR